MGTVIDEQALKEGGVSTRTKTATLVLLGNPNTGKTTLFNALTGLRQKTGNFPGVTVERKMGSLQIDTEMVELIDLPGTYSLTARSLDEIIATDVLLGQQNGTELPDAVVVVADASNLERNLFLVTQVLECGLPTILVLNMYDVAVARGIHIDVAALARELDCWVVPVVASQRKGLRELKAAMKQAWQEPKSSSFGVDLGKPIEEATTELLHFLETRREELGRTIHRVEALRVLIDQNGEARRRLNGLLDEGFQSLLTSLSQKSGVSEIELVVAESEARYKRIVQILSTCVHCRPVQKPSRLAQITDRLLTHPLVGVMIFGLLMATVFQALYSWAAPLMGWLDASLRWLGDRLTTLMPPGALQSLLVDGVIAGVGSVIIFLPQIIILFGFVAILEDCGYMARAAFLMDRLMRWAGLSGRAFVPLLSSFACAIPGIMATRGIENRRDRLATILVAPLMSCSARLPVYTLLIAAFIPAQTLWGGWLGLQGCVLFLMYILGLVIAVPVAWILKKTLLRGETPPFVMEMPPYKIPDWRSVVLRMWGQGKDFLIRAGTIIFSIAILVWGLAYFPRPQAIARDYQAQVQAIAQRFAEQAGPLARRLDPQLTPEGFPTHPRMQQVYLQCVENEATFHRRREELSSQDSSAELAAIEAEYREAQGAMVSRHGENWEIASAFHRLEQERDRALEESAQTKTGEYLRQSFLGRMGRWLEPVIHPLGWDWKIGMATLAAFPAREVVISTLGVIYNLGRDQDESSPGLRQAMQRDRWPDGRPVFTPLIALCLMVFFALCCQCASTLVIIRRETGSWKWSVITFAYMTTLAYLAAWLTYRVGQYLGY